MPQKRTLQPEIDFRGAEPSFEVQTGRAAAEEQFQGDHAVQAPLPRFIDDTHSAPANFFEHFVVANRANLRAADGNVSQEKAIAAFFLRTIPKRQLERAPGAPSPRRIGRNNCATARAR